MRFLFLLGVFIFLPACGNNIEEIDRLLADETSTSVERGRNIKIVYSDSAIVKVVIYAPVMERVLNNNETKDVFPKGIQLDFIDKDQKPYSHLKADKAIRDERVAKVFATGHVEFFNDKGEKLESPELIWDERERIVFTDKIVRITQSEKGDTTIGFGFKANQDFTRFEIKKKVHGKINVGDLFAAIK
jgi:LPS export ABC transporter protein LptC